MSTGVRSFTLVYKPMNYYSIQKASFSCLITSNFNSKTVLHKPSFNNYLKNTMMSGAGGGKNLPKLPSNNNASTSAPIMPGSSTDSLPKTKEEFDKVKPFSHSFPPIDKGTPALSSVSQQTPVTPSPVKMDDNATKKALKAAEDHQKIGESFNPINNEVLAIENSTTEINTQELKDNELLETSQSFKSGLITGIETALPTFLENEDLEGFSSHKKTPELYEDFVVPEKKKGTETEAIKMLADARTALGKNLLPHEMGHVLLAKKDEQAGTVTVTHILTHAKKNKTTNKENPLIDTIDVDGKPKPQRIAALETGRLLIEKDRGKTFENHPAATIYANDINRKPKIEQAMEDKPKLHTVRPHIDAAELHTPEGRSIDEEDNNINDKDD